MKEGRELQDYLYILFTRKWIIITIFCITVGATAWYTFTSPKIYEAVATIMITPREFSVPVSSSFFPAFLPTIRDYCELLQSKKVAKRAVEKLKEKNEKFSFLFSTEPEETVLANISIKPVVESNVIKIYGKGPSSHFAVELANALVDGFIEEELLTARESYDEQCKYLEEQIPYVEKKLEECENEIKEYKEKNKIFSLSSETNELVKRLSDVDKIYNETVAEYSSLSKKLEAMQKQLTEEKQTIIEKITKVSTPYIIELRKELVELETNYSLYLTRGLSPNSPKMEEIRKSIERTKEKLVEETKKMASEMVLSDPFSYSEKLIEEILFLQINLESINAKKDALSNIRKKYENLLLSLPKGELELAQLERKRNIYSSTYALLIESYQKAQIAKAGRISNIRIVERAGTPKYPIKPRKKLNLILGSLFGIILGIFGVLIAEYVGGSIKNEKDVKLYTNLDVIGSIPKGKSLPPYVVEAYRVLRTNISFLSPDKPLKVITITSALPREGKSTITANLGRSIASEGKSVLVIEGDLRRPSLDKLFNLRTENGLIHFLTGKLEIDSTIIFTGIDNLYYLPAGGVPINPTELLSSNRMTNLIEKMKKEFDYVLIDSPPVLSVADASVLCSKSDGVLIVVEVNKTNKNALVKAEKTLEMSKVKILGVVLNLIPYSYGYPYYHYRHYYSKKT